MKKIEIWKRYKPIHGKIEDVFKLCKSGLGLKKITQIHTRIDLKNNHNNCIFSRTTHNTRIQPKTALQKLSET